ncbi:phosphatidylglycerophosphatase A [Immundisolibacter sp.]|uniref:phosphatidylglycerophosphatase A family protein n=1 Tax=Immundisolibacter sp. TaxID=1934948 RepID=UPI002606BD30|nr:phosphatidylglycerophosphatase A [Immundisolibacter sp.]MDD3650293.1 phosphatidylglycerophosphatase A [Immundisolibacter sp.]
MTTSAERPRRPTAALLRDPACALALGFGAGLAPRAPGTCGALLGLPLAAALTRLPVAMAVLVLGLLSVLGVWCCARAGQRLGVSDHPAIVWDEVIGMALALLAVPFGWWQYLLGFALFRLFDILKPWPVGALDRQVGGGLGVMLDDLAAGVLAGVTLQLALLAAARLA